MSIHECYKKQTRNFLKTLKSLLSKDLRLFKKNVLMCYMAQTSDTASRLRAVAPELLAIADSLSSPKLDVEFPPTAAERMALGKCLNCERKPDEISVIRRGLCQACYQKSQRMLSSNPLLENQLISKGLLAPSGFNPNPEVTPLDEMFRKAWDKASARSDVEELAKKVSVKRQKKKGAS
jgi:hypothetical protein